MGITPLEFTLEKMHCLNERIIMYEFFNWEQELLLSWQRDPLYIYRIVTKHIRDNYKGTKKKSYIYFIEAHGTDRVKIGHTTNIKKRIYSLQTSSPVRLGIVLLLKGDDVIERTIHGAFRNDRMHGEWFMKSDRMNRLIELLSRDMNWQHAKLAEKINTRRY